MNLKLFILLDFTAIITLGQDTIFHPLIEFGSKCKFFFILKFNVMYKENKSFLQKCLLFLALSPDPSILIVIRINTVEIPRNVTVKFHATILILRWSTSAASEVTETSECTKMYRVSQQVLDGKF